MNLNGNDDGFCGVDGFLCFHVNWNSKRILRVVCLFMGFNLFTFLLQNLFSGMTNKMVNIYMFFVLLSWKWKTRLFLSSCMTQICEEIWVHSEILAQKVRLVNELLQPAHHLCHSVSVFKPSSLLFTCLFHYWRLLIV